MILELAVFTVTPGHADGFVAAYAKAVPLITGSSGCRSARLARGVENPDQFTLFVEWESLQAHLEGFRESDRFPRWRALIGPHLDGAEVHHVAYLDPAP